jgi:hypothetical protein
VLLKSCIIKVVCAGVQRGDAMESECCVVERVWVADWLFGYRSHFRDQSSSNNWQNRRAGKIPSLTRRNLEAIDQLMKYEESRVAGYYDFVDAFCGSRCKFG